MPRKVIVHLALGTNLGERALNLSLARKFVSEFIEDLHYSSIYETPPWGVLDQPHFLNQVLRGSTTLSPLIMLDQLKTIEKTMGRQETIRFGPRIIDLDILLYGERVIHHQRLQVPHPRMLERAFVMLPLAELSPGLVIPGDGRPVDEVLLSLDTTGISLFLSQ